MTAPDGTGHDGEGVSSEYLRGWKAGRDWQREQTAAAPPEPLRPDSIDQFVEDVLDFQRMREAGFLDSYLNIEGVSGEAEAEALLSADMAAYAALARSAAPPGQPLDVERLARAFINQRSYVVTYPSGWRDSDLRWLARQVAAEYARLAESSERPEAGE